MFQCLIAFKSLDNPLRNSIQKVEHQILISILLHLLIRQRIKKFLKYLDLQETALNDIRKNIFACLFSVHNTISFSRHEQVCLMRLRFERYFSHH